MFKIEELRPYSGFPLSQPHLSKDLLCTHKSFQPPKSPILGDFELNLDKAFGKLEQAGSHSQWIVSSLNASVAPHRSLTASAQSPPFWGI
jgi:hypothetical protein